MLVISELKYQMDEKLLQNILTQLAEKDKQIAALLND